jgi:hypothetical protein
MLFKSSPAAEVPCVSLGSDCKARAMTRAISTIPNSSSGVMQCGQQGVFSVKPPGGSPNTNLAGGSVGTQRGQQGVLGARPLRNSPSSAERKHIFMQGLKQTLQDNMQQLVGKRGSPGCHAPTQQQAGSR